MSNKKAVLYPIYKGQLLSFQPYNDTDVEWVENREFNDTLTYLGFSRGRSSATFLFEGSNEEKYTMFMKDMDTLLKSPKNIIDMQVSAVWTYQKRGQNFGIRLADSEIK